MARKVKEPEVLASATTTFNQVIDVKLSMKDLVELAITEKEIELEDAINTASEAKKEAYTENIIFKNKILKKAYQKALLKKVEVYKDFLPNAKEQVEKRINAKYPTDKKLIDDCDSWSSSTIRTIDGYNTIFVFMTKNGDQLTVELKSGEVFTTKALNKANEDIKERVNAFHILYKAENKAENAANEWQRQGKRVKNNIVKQQLASSESGQQLLKQISVAAKSIALPAVK